MEINWPLVHSTSLLPIFPLELFSGKAFVNKSRTHQKLKNKIPQIIKTLDPITLKVIIEHSLEISSLVKAKYRGHLGSEYYKRIFLK